jgi:hypothetical protein
MCVKQSCPVSKAAPKELGNCIHHLRNNQQGDRFLLPLFKPVARLESEQLAFFVLCASAIQALFIQKSLNLSQGSSTNIEQCPACCQDERRQNCYYTPINFHVFIFLS